MIDEYDEYIDRKTDAHVVREKIRLFSDKMLGRHFRALEGFTPDLRRGFSDVVSEIMLSVNLAVHADVALRVQGDKAKT